MRKGAKLNSAESLSADAIASVLPHRYPFLLVDRVITLELGDHIVAVKNVTANEPFFLGHFPGRPVMPGVLIIEALAQAGAILMLQGLTDAADKIPLFAGIDKARFRRQVIPGDQLRMELNVVRSRGASCKLDGRATVDDELVAEAKILAVVDEISRGVSTPT